MHEFHKLVVEQVFRDQLENGNLPPPPAALEGKLDQIEVKIAPFVSLPYIAEHASLLAKSLVTKKWQFFYAKAGFSFITSDTPVTYFSGPKGEYGINHLHSEVVFPIRRDLLVVISNKGEHGKKIECNIPTMKMFNRGSARAAKNYVVASERKEGLAILTHKYRDERQRMSFE